MFAFNAQSNEVNTVLNNLLNATLETHATSPEDSKKKGVARAAIYPLSFNILSSQILGGRSKLSFNQVTSALRENIHGAILLGWNRHEVASRSQLGNLMLVCVNP